MRIRDALSRHGPPEAGGADSVQAGDLVLPKIGKERLFHFKQTQAKCLQHVYNMLGKRGGLAPDATHRGSKNLVFYRVKWLSGHSTYRLATHELQDDKLNTF